ncbi:MAG: sigma-70 family RNA polymerase sigma factor [Actinobacteria bacterium]|nr:sigma-70 family RNA polymerase sigma factor [Actinomycetota bacterium]
MPEPRDEELVRRYVDGDQGAFADLVRRHETRVYNLAYRLVGNADDAREASQEAFLTCVRKLRGFRFDSAFGTWLYRVTANASYDILRRRKRAPVPVEELPERAGESDEAAGTADQVDVERALARIPDDFRLVVVLHDLQGLPYEEVAEIVGVPVGTVKSRLHRGRIALGRLLGGPDGEQPGERPASKGRRKR